MAHETELHPGEGVELNPQPIPPGGETVRQGVQNPGAKVALNPQPIPPGREPVHVAHDPYSQLLHGLSHELGRHARAIVHGGASSISYHQPSQQHPSLVEVQKRLLKEELDKAAAAAEAAAPEQLGQWNAQIGFPDGVPVGGWANLTLQRDGGYAFNGHLHDSGSPSFVGVVAWAVKASNGKALTFVALGEMAGTFDSGSRDANWTSNGTAAEIADLWEALAQGWQYQWQAAVNFDPLSLINNLKTGLQVAGDIIPIVHP